jgi:hypothetical protein
MVGNMDAFVSNLNSFNGNSFKNLPSFTNIPGLTGPHSQEHHTDMSVVNHPSPQVPLQSGQAGRVIDISGQGPHNTESEFSFQLKLNCWPCSSQVFGFVLQRPCLKG